MRATFWTLFLFALGAAAAVFLGTQQSTVTLFWPPHRIDMAFNLFALLLLALFVFLYLVMRALSALLAMPAQTRRWRLQHRERAMQAALLDTVSHFVAGRYVRSQKSAKTALSHERQLGSSAEKLPYSAQYRALSHLMLAESAHLLKDNSSRDEHYFMALDQAELGQEREVKEGVLLRGVHWALSDRDAQLALQRLEALPTGVTRRMLALRLKLRAARMAGQTFAALEAARLLTKHGAFSENAARGVLRSLSVEIIDSAHDEAQLRQAWSKFEDNERAMSDVACAAAQRLMLLAGDIALARRWLLPSWEAMTARHGALGPEQAMRVVKALAEGFIKFPQAVDADWLKRVESAQLQSPADPLLQYLAGVVFMQSQLWGKAQQLLNRSLTGLKDVELQRQVWRALAELAVLRGDEAQAAQAYRQAAAK